MAKRSVRDVAWAGKRALVRPIERAPAGRGRGGRHPHPGGPAHPPLFAGAGRVHRPHVPPGTPKGKVRPDLSLAPVARRLKELLERPVTLAPAVVGPEVQELRRVWLPERCSCWKTCASIPGRRPTIQLARELAALADAFVADAFGAAHRAHASTVGVASYLPAVAGLLLEKEVAVLRRCWRIPGVPSSPCWGAPRYRIKSPCCSTSSAGPTRCCWAAAWCSPSCRPGAWRSAAPCWRRSTWS